MRQSKRAEDGPGGANVSLHNFRYNYATTSARIAPQ
jgi:hypothetical protein